MSRDHHHHSESKEEEEEELKSVYEPMMDYNKIKKRKGKGDMKYDRDPDDENAKKSGRYLGIPYKKDVFRQGRYKFQDKEGRMYVQIEQGRNTKEIKSILWLANRFQAVDYNPDVDLFMFVVDPPHSTEKLRVDNDIVLYDPATQQEQYKGVIKDLYSINQHNVMGIVMISLSLSFIALGR